MFRLLFDSGFGLPIPASKEPENPGDPPSGSYGVYLGFESNRTHSFRPRAVSCLCTPSNRHAPGELRPKPAGTARGGVGKRKTGTFNVAYKMVAERDNAKVRVERESRLLIFAKAKIWASEGWDVVVTDSEGKTYEPSEFEKLSMA